MVFLFSGSRGMPTSEIPPSAELTPPGPTPAGPTPIGPTPIGPTHGPDGQPLTPSQQARIQRLWEARDDAESWPEWYLLTPQERWRETAILWHFYLQAGGSLDPEPDSQSPFDALYPRSPPPAYGGAGVRVLRRGGV
jgi:hypothetical protein